MSFQIQRRGFTRVDALARSVVTDLLANGFRKVWPTTEFGTSSKSIILEAGPTVDPLHATQPWHMKMQWNPGFLDATSGVSARTEVTEGGMLDIAVGTPLQFGGTTGAHSTYIRREYYRPSSGGTGTVTDEIRDIPGLLGSAALRNYKVPQGSTAVAVQNQHGWPDRTFIDRARLKIQDSNGTDDTRAYPMSYQLVITDRGVCLVVWEDGQDNVANRYSWFVVQRPVDNKTGKTIVEGKCPLHCVYGLMTDSLNMPWSNTSANYNFRRFVVREADVLAPYPTPSEPRLANSLYGGATVPMMGVDATNPSIDYHAIMNGEQQVSITENNKYVLTFPNGLNTQRYAYTHELDMIAYTSADVVSGGTVVPIQVYGESTPRKYLALNANGPNNTGMRLLVLVEGGGIATPYVFK